MSKNKSDTADDTFQEGTTSQPHPRSPSSAADTPDETFQEDTTPVQAFSAPVLPGGVGSELRLRQGRPPRVAPARPRESAEVAAMAQARTQSMSQPADAASEIAAAIGGALTPAGLEARYPGLPISSVGAVAGFAAGAATGAAIGALLGGAAGAAIGAQVGAALAAQAEATKIQPPAEKT
jgi:hypothetical protein